MPSEDMVSRYISGGPGPLYGAGWNDGVKVQNEADMAHEVACPRCLWPSAYGFREDDCGLCSGTGRVTIGRIVELDRARKVETAHG